MIVMLNHKWVDKEEIINVIWDEENDDIREIRLKSKGSRSIFINKNDVIALAQEFNLLVFEKESSLQVK